MKKLFLSLVMIAASSTITFGTIRTVSNYTVSPGQYTAIQPAINAANAGDTILVHGSPIIYIGNVTIDRQLTLMGAGIAPQVSNVMHTKINGNFFLGSSSSGTNIIGFTFNACNVSVTVTGLSNITVSRNSFSTVFGVYLFSGTSNVIISENFFVECGVNNNNGANQNIIITNNVFRYGFACCGANNNLGSFSNAVNVIVSNNVFISNQTGVNAQFAGTGAHNINFTNNIFNGVDFTGVTNNTFTNNLTFNCVPNNIFSINGNVDAGNAVNFSQNITGTSPDFVNQSIINADSVSSSYGYWTINSGSPTLSGMAGDPDMGPYGGGAFNFNNAGASSLPFVYSLTIPSPNIQPGTYLQIDVIGKKHN